MTDACNIADGANDREADFLEYASMVLNSEANQSLRESDAILAEHAVRPENRAIPSVWHPGEQHASPSATMIRFGSFSERLSPEHFTQPGTIKRKEIEEHRNASGRKKISCLNGVLEPSFFPAIQFGAFPSEGESQAPVVARHPYELVLMKNRSQSESTAVSSDDEECHSRQGTQERERHDDRGLRAQPLSEAEGGGYTMVNPVKIPPRPAARPANMEMGVPPEMQARKFRMPSDNLKRHSSPEEQKMNLFIPAFVPPKRKRTKIGNAPLGDEVIIPRTGGMDAYDSRADMHRDMRALPCPTPASKSHSPQMEEASLQQAAAPSSPDITDEREPATGCEIEYSGSHSCESRGRSFSDESYIHLDTAVEGDEVPQFTEIVGLALPEDANFLGPLHCFLRENVCALIATEDDIAMHTPGRHVAAVQGQVGIGCIHCHKLPAKERSSRAVCFPFSIGRIYQSAADIQRFHINECTMIPQAVLDKFNQLLSAKGSRGLATRQYWVSSAKKIGLVDTPNGIRFGRDPSEIVAPASEDQDFSSVSTDRGTPVASETQDDCEGVSFDLYRIPERDKSLHRASKDQDFTDVSVGQRVGAEAYERRRQCHCKKSNCLKLYCPCFSGSLLCSSILCGCSNCQNTEMHREERQAAIKRKLSRDPNVFASKRPTRSERRSEMLHGNTVHDRGSCSCKKSKCIKLYCECYFRNSLCESHCECLGCENQE